MENFKNESIYMKFCYEFWAFIRMYEGCSFQPRLSKILNVSIYQNTWPSICFKKYGRTFETLSRGFETLGRPFEGIREN